MVFASSFANPRSLWQKSPLISSLSHLRASSRLGPVARHVVDSPIEEELLPGDRLRNFHPTQPGEVLDGRFLTIAKLGFGAGSTVWLAENLKLRWKKSLVPRYVSVKIAALDTDASGETNNSKIICNAKPSHEGRSYFRTPVDEFQLKGPAGSHSCLVYVPMRETLHQLQHRLRRQRLAPPYFKFFVYCLLQALDYLHTECRLIHTDIKDDNIMVTLENGSVLAEFVSAQKNKPQPKHVRKEDGRATYISQGDFGPLKGPKLLPELADFNLAVGGLDADLGHITPIQSHRYRAPEALLGCPWTYSADIWNIGLLMWNLLEDVSLFGQPAGGDGEYDAHVHLAQMISLLGRPPEEMIKRERLFRRLRLGSMINPHGQVCKNTNEYWGGPFFDDNGRILREDLVEEGKTLANTVTELAGDDKESFLDFASGMLQWLPDRRKTAGELLKHPFLDSVYEVRARYI